MQSSCPASPHPPACSPTLSLLNLSRPPGRRRPAMPEAFAVLTNARLGFCATPTLCDSAPRYCAKNPSAYQHSYPSVVAPRPDDCDAPPAYTSMWTGLLPLDPHSRRGGAGFICVSKSELEADDKMK
ncbi:hypothetical protein K438DRAFT_2026822 [Mycena galopus ATCC 62051]|nr:hypothetical protein K438DRAFT_2026822 [Mycena galopus ATCC 62051]